MITFGKDQELFSAPSGNNTVYAQFFHCRSYLDQYFVTCGMTILVINGLKVIYVDHRDTVCLVIVICFLKPLHHVMSVIKMREPVLVRTF